MNKKLIKHLGSYCLGPTITVKQIKKLKNQINKNEGLKTAESYFTILAGKTRLKILYLLKNNKELCVCDMASILTTTTSAVSHQLKILRLAKLVKFHREAQTIFYYLSQKGKKELKDHF